jgi:hypothetical protein
MPGSVLAELILRPVFEIVLYFVGYLTGQVVVPAVTFGLYTVEPVSASGRRPRPRLKRKAAPIASRVVSADLAALVGLLSWAVALVIGYLLWRAAGV